MAEVRPDPDQLLARVKAEEARQRRGRLRIFFGANAGVGKTYAMLEAARSAVSSGIDVVVGYVELHGRPETERLLAGLEQLPPLPITCGTVRREFDLDAALARNRNCCSWMSSRTPTSAVAIRHRATKTLAGHRGAARGRHRRLHDGQCAAPRVTERRGRADHRRAPARDGTRSRVRPGRRDRAGRSAAR